MLRVNLSNILSYLIFWFRITKSREVDMSCQYDIHYKVLRQQ